ncbi:hypothetical protein AAGF08_10940 [Algoriphagus sp. SE2]|uniref:hypothetical protein n=1 Tax=Algoriphagus sp. SE2 TaxID=3141536 RepID=UPI0031CD67EC
MNAAQFIELISKSDTTNKTDFLSLKKIQENFPYFQIPHVLVARYEYDNNPDKTPESLGFAAITSPNRIWLKELVERTSEASNKKQGVKKEVELKKEKPKPVRKRRKAPADDLLETIKRKEKKTIVDAKKREQIDLIKAFSKRDIKLATIKEIEANQNNENLAASSTEINDNLLSESFAKLLVSQSKKPKAKKIYEKLMLKFPDKRSYFADLIEKLKE